MTKPSRIDEAAVAVLARAEYSPATNQGVPTAVWFSQWITFQDEGVTMLEPVQTSRAPSPTGPDPLYIVDGVMVAKADIPKLAEESVESVEILKADAALSLYGERGKNGVVRITTKAGAGVDADVPSEIRQREPVPAGSDLREELDVGGVVTRVDAASKRPEAGQPLIVIDGVIQAADVSLDDLDAADIDHVEIIKGEAARSLYGERAKNGVVQIVTKSGG